MLFLAEVNLAEAKSLNDFPASGLLQVFLPTVMEGSDLLAAEEGGDAALVRWFEDARGEAVLSVPGIFRGPRGRSPLSGPAREDGVPLRLEPDILPPLPHFFPLWKAEPDIHGRLPAEREAEARSKGWEDRVDALRESYGTSWIGGHPSFVQEDPRIHRAELREFDRVLLHLGEDAHFKFFESGTSGELSLMIRRDDLLARRFDRTWLTYDCS
jgi:uncharacterized protein YwqG